MSILNGLIPKALSFWKLTWVELKVDREALDDESLKIWARANILPNVMNIGMSQLRLYNVYIQWIDAIWNTLVWVQAEIWVALIWAWKAEQELEWNWIIGDERDRILSVLHDWLKAQLIYSRILHKLDSIDRALQTMGDFETRAREIKQILDDENQKLLANLQWILQSTNQRFQSTLSQDRMFSYNPANYALSEIIRAKWKLNAMKQEVFVLQDNLSSWIEERLQAVTILREETGLELELLSLFQGKEEEITAE